MIAVPRSKRGKTSRSAIRARDRVELVALREPGRRRDVVIRAERDDEDVRVERPRVGLHAPRGWVDGAHRRLDEPHTWFDDVAIWVAHLRELDPSEHDVELREAEDERVALVDEHEIESVAERIRKDRRQLESSEAGAEHHYACRHCS